MKQLPVVIAVLASLSASAPASAQTVLLDDNFDDGVAAGTYTLGADWTDGSTFGNWYANFLGFGVTEVVNATNSRLSMQPCDVDVCAGGTRSALVTTTQAFNSDIGAGLEVEARVKLVQQLRDVGPNPWETPWLLWNVQTDASGIPTYANYLAMKTNGVELGVITGNNGQIFLATRPNPTIGMGVYKTVTINQYNNGSSPDTVRVWVNGNEVDLNGAAHGKAFEDMNGVLSRSGTAGLYTEDAKVEFDDVLINAL